MKIRYLVNKIIHPNTYSSEAFKKYLIRGGVKIGNNTWFFDPRNTKIDKNRMDYIEIGSNCCITSGVEILCHDYSWTSLVLTHHEILPDPGRPVHIGDNVFLGWGSIVIGPVSVGSNIIIGAHSVVTKDIPDNSVWAGNPAKYICSFDEYYEKKKRKYLEDAKFRARFIYKNTGKVPTLKQMGWFCVLFLERDNKSNEYIKTLPYKGGPADTMFNVFMKTNKVFENYEKFLEFAVPEAFF